MRVVLAAVAVAVPAVVVGVGLGADIFDIARPACFRFQFALERDDVESSSLDHVSKIHISAVSTLPAVCAQSRFEGRISKMPRVAIA